MGSSSASEPPAGGPRTRRVPLVACLFVLAFGWLYSAHLGRELRFKDERDYLLIGRHVFASGTFSRDGMRPTAYRPPVYPIVLGALLRAGGGATTVRMANYVALCGTILLGYLFFVRRGLVRAGAMAAAMAALYPPFLYTASTLYPQTLGALLLAAVLVVLPVGGPPGAARGALVGLLGGLLVLTIPTLLAAMALVLAWMLFRGGRRALPGALATGFCLCAVLGVWGARNHAAFGSFVPLTTNSGRNLLLGNSELTTPTSGVNVDISAYEARAADLGEVERDRFYRTAAVEWIAEDPVRWAGLYALKTLNYFNVYNTYATDEEIGVTKSVLLCLTYLPLLGVLVWRLARLNAVPLFPAEGLLLLLYFGMALATALFFTRIRFRLPLDHILIWAAAAFLVRVLAGLSPRLRGAPAAPRQ